VSLRCDLAVCVLLHHSVVAFRLHQLEFFVVVLLDRNATELTCVGGTGLMRVLLAESFEEEQVVLG
jgi:hypothetical protein